MNGISRTFGRLIWLILNVKVLICLSRSFGSLFVDHDYLGVDLIDSEHSGGKFGYPDIQISHLELIRISRNSIFFRFMPVYHEIVFKMSQCPFQLPQLNQLLQLLQLQQLPQLLQQLIFIWTIKSCIIIKNHFQVSIF